MRWLTRPADYAIPLRRKPEPRTVAARQRHLLQYDERNLRLKMTQGAGTPEAATSTFNYDPNRNVTSLISSRNLTTTLQYDGFDRHVKTTDAVGGQTVTHYDPAGNAVSVSALGQPGGPSPADNSGAGNVLLRLETYAYDELNRRFQADQQPVNGASFVASGVSTGRPPSVVPGGLNPPAISRRRHSPAGAWRSSPAALFDTVGRHESRHQRRRAGNTIQYRYDGSNNDSNRNRRRQIGVVADRLRPSSSMTIEPLDAGDRQLLEHAPGRTTAATI